MISGWLSYARPDHYTPQYDYSLAAICSDMISKYVLNIPPTSQRIVYTNFILNLPLKCVVVSVQTKELGVVVAFQKRNKNAAFGITCKNTNHGKWFEPRSISSLSSAIVRVSVVLKRTVGDSDSEDDFRSGCRNVSLTVTNSSFQNYTHRDDHTKQNKNTNQCLLIIFLSSRLVVVL